MCGSLRRWSFLRRLFCRHPLAADRVAFANEDARVERTPLARRRLAALRRGAASPCARCRDADPRRPLARTRWLMLLLPRPTLWVCRAARRLHHAGGAPPRRSRWRSGPHRRDSREGVAEVVVVHLAFFGRFFPLVFNTERGRSCSGGELRVWP